MILLPADYSPQPVWASGMMQLKTGFSGSVISILKPSNSAQSTFAFGPDGRLPVADMDAFMAGEICRVVTRVEQMGGRNLFSDAARGPKIGALQIGTHRCMWMESDCQITNDAPTGQVYGMVTGDILPLNIGTDAFTVMQVLQLHNAIPCNSMAGPEANRVCTFSMIATGQRHHRLFAEGNRYPGFALNAAGGGYVLEDGSGFRAASTNAWLETSPVVLTCITGPGGTFFGQNNDFRSVSGNSAIAPPRIASQLRVGYHDQSEPPTDPKQNEAMGGAELATLVWNQALTLNQAAKVAGSLYDIVGFDYRHSNSGAPLIMVFTDSVWAGFKGDDLRGWDHRLMQQLSPKVRWANFAVPGSTIMFPTTVNVVNANTLGLFPGWVAQAIRQHRGRVHCVWGCPLNDFSVGTGMPTPQQAYDNGTLKLLQAIRAVDPTATISICTATRVNSPTTDTSMTTCSQLIRDGAAANNYNVIEVRNDPVMGVWNSSIDWESNHNLPYKDGTHPSNAGCDRLAFLIKPTLQAWLTGLGIT